MIYFHSNMAIGNSVAKETNKIIRNIRKHKLQMGVYVICLAVNGRDIFDIIPTYMLSANDYKGRDIMVLGIAKGKGEATEMACQMITEIYQATGDLDIRRYFA